MSASENRTSRPRPLAIIGNWEWDFASGTTRWSEGVYRLLDLEPNKVEPSYDLFVGRMHPEDRDRGEVAGFRAVANGESIDSEFRVIQPDGAVRWLANKGEVFADPAGHPSWAAGALFDITEIRQAQSEIAVREQRLRALAKASSLGSWRASPEGGVIEAGILQSLTGWARDQIMGHGWLEAVHPQDRESLRAAWAETVRIRCSCEFRYRVQVGSGGYRWMLSRAVPIHDDDGSIREWVGTVQDIQGERELEEALRVAESRLTCLLDAARLVSWDYDLATGRVVRSANARAVLGIGPVSFGDVNAWVHPDDRKCVVERLHHTRDSGEPYDLEYRIIDESKSIRWVRVQGQLLQNPLGGADRIVGITQDVSAIKDAEAAKAKLEDELLQLRCRFAGLAKLAGQFVWRAEVDGKLIDMAGWQDFTGQSRSEAENWGWLTAVHPADRERLRTALERQSAMRSSLSVDYRLRTRTGDYEWVRSRAEPLVRPDGTVREWIGTCELVQAEHALDVNCVAEQPLERDPERMTGCLIRAARATLRWSVRDLAAASGVSVSTIKRIEDEGAPAPGRDLRKLSAIRTALEAAGVRFFASPQGGLSGVSESGIGTAGASTGRSHLDRAAGGAPTLPD